MKRVPLAEAKARLSEWIRLVERGRSVVVTRHGKAVAALVPPDDIEHLERLKKMGPEGGLASIAGGWDGSEELASLIDRTARTSRRRVDPGT